MKRKGFFLSVFSFSSVIIVFMRHYSPLRSRASVHYKAQSALFFFSISTPYHPMKRNLYFCERWRVEVGCVDGGSREWIYLHLSKLVSGLRLFSFLEMFFAKNDYVIFFFVSANKVILELVYLK